MSGGPIYLMNLLSDLFPLLFLSAYKSTEMISMHNKELEKNFMDQVKKWVHFLWLWIHSKVFLSAQKFLFIFLQRSNIITLHEVVNYSISVKKRFCKVQLGRTRYIQLGICYHVKLMLNLKQHCTQNWS